jgi:hypothetical protein
MTSDEFERRVHRDCLRILRFLVKERYESAGECAAALALLAEDRAENRLLLQSRPAADPYDLKLLNAWDRDDDDHAF